MPQRDGAIGVPSYIPPSAQHMQGQYGGVPPQQQQYQHQHQQPYEQQPYEQQQQQPYHQQQYQQQYQQQFTAPPPVGPPPLPAAVSLEPPGAGGDDASTYYTGAVHVSPEPAFTGGPAPVVNIPMAPPMQYPQ